MSRRIPVFPLHDLGGLVIVPDIAQQFLAEILDRGKDPAGDDLALDLREPELDLVEPRGVRRREMQVHRRVGLQKLGDPSGLVGREVISDHVNLLTGGLIGHKVCQKGDELFRGMPVRCLAQHFSGLGIECGVQRERAVPVIFEPMPFGPPRRQGQHRIFAIQGLNGRFLIHAKHGRMLGWVQIQADDVRSLRLKIWIGRGHIALQPMRLESMLRPDPRDPHVADPEVGCQFAGTPMRGPVGWCPPRGLQDAGFCLWGIAQGRLPAMTAIQARHPFSGKPATPRGNKPATAPHGVTHGSPRGPLSQEQNDAGPPRGVGTPAPASQVSAQFYSFTARQENRVVHEHEYSL